MWFDPGVSAIFTAYAAKHHFDEIQYLDIVIVMPEITEWLLLPNFNPEINIREITQNGRFMKTGQWVKTGPLEIHKTLTYPNTGKESLICTMRNWNLWSRIFRPSNGLVSDDLRTGPWPICGWFRISVWLSYRRGWNSTGEDRTLQFLKAVLPDPKSWGPTTIMARLRSVSALKGSKTAKNIPIIFINNCDHEAAFKETGTQAVSYTTGVPAALGAAMFAKGLWKGAGVYNVEQFDPDPFLAELGRTRIALGWKIRYRPGSMIDKDTILSNWDLSTVPSPCYVLHETLLADNLRVIDKVRKATGAEIIVALKANAMWSIFRNSADIRMEPLPVRWRRLVLFEEYGAPAHTYAPVYTEGEIDEYWIAATTSLFNSLGQYERFGRRAHRAGVSCGLRVNPEFSTVETDFIQSGQSHFRLGILATDLTHLPEGIDGLHFHSLCESRPDDLRGTLAAVEERFGRFSRKSNGWIWGRTFDDS